MDARAFSPLRDLRVTRRGFKVPFEGRLFLAVVTSHFAFLVFTLTFAVLSVKAGHDGTLIENEVYGARVYASTVEGVLAVAFLMFAYSAVFFENVFELAAFQIAAVCLTIRVFYEFDGVLASQPVDGPFGTKGEEHIATVQVVLTCVYQVIYIVLGYFVFKSFGWHVYKNVGADVSMISYFKAYQQFLSVLKLDLMFCIILLFTGLMGRAWSTMWGFITSLLSLLFTVVWAYVAWQAAKREDKLGMRLVLLFSILEPIYIIYKTVVLGISRANNETAPSLEFETALPRTELSLGYMLCLAILALTIRAGVVTMAITVTRNFNKGLRDHLMPSTGTKKNTNLPLFT
mmetsp:Transcript_33572/g.76770  ORF Transcript_33572/g.76770 Transcript_33572/m.76770 type:complete len:345 (-) Transcript_33572:768-1802(-)